MKEKISSLSLRAKILLSYSAIIGMTLIMDIYAFIANKETWLDAIGNILFLIMSIGIALITSNKIVKPIQMVTDRINTLSKGDLTQEPLDVKSNDDIGVMAESLNNLQKNIKDVMINISSTSEMVASHSEELTHSANEINAGAEQVAATMQELAGGAEQQASTINDFASVSTMFVETTEEMNQYGREIESSSQEVLNLTIKGQKLMNASTEQMRNINHVVGNVVNKVKHLHEQSQEVNKLVEIIKDVADKTSLLSINAKIQAAHAGEHGKGFSVVADEVGKLAEQTEASVENISKIIQNIQIQFDQTVESLASGTVEVQKGSEQIEQTNETFNTIKGSVEEMVQNIIMISAGIAEIAISSEEMNENIQNMASISQEASAGIEETSAAAQQTTASTEEIAQSSDQLARMAEELNDLVRNFKL